MATVSPWHRQRPEERRTVMSMYISYDDEPVRARSATATAGIWRSCARRAAGWIAFYAVLAGVVFILGALGLLDWHLTVT